MIFHLTLGYFFFYTGRLFHNRSFMLVGHHLISIGSAGLFGLNANWIEKNCPLVECSKCTLWTCQAYVKGKRTR